MSNKSEVKINNTKPLTKFQEMLSKLNISEQYTTVPRQKYDKVKRQIFPKKNYNYESDLMELPKTKNGYKYLLCIVDLFSNYFDCEPLKNKTAESTLAGMKTIFKRKIITEPEASIRTDAGSEFKSVFNKYLYDHNILHLVALPDRHKQNGNVENLNRQIGRILNTYMTNKAIETGEDFYEWTDIIDLVRKELNNIKKHPKDQNINKYVPNDINIQNFKPKYKIGDLVYRKLEVPVDKFGNKLHGSKFRVGDNRFELVPRKIVQVLVYTGVNPYRYILNGFSNVSYSENELIPAKDNNEEKFVVRKIIDKMTKNKIIYYKVWFKRELKKNALWLSKKQLLEDDLDEYIKEYEESIKSKKK